LDDVVFPYIETNHTDMDALIKLLNDIRKMSPALERHLRSKIRRYRFKKGQNISTEGEVAKLILYLEQGLVRSCSKVNKEQASNYFMRDGDIIISVESFLQQVPALESLEALEECIGWGITWEELEEAYELFMEFNIHGRIIEAIYYCKSEERHRSKHRRTPEQMYEWLIEKDPELIRRVPHSYVASYLDVSRATYNRIKKDYADRIRLARPRSV
jgi:CRP-like cAMP-binding protein